MIKLDGLLEELRVARLANISVYARMAALTTDAASLGWRVRRPEDPDVTLLLIQSAINASPAEAAAAMEEVYKNDEEIMRLSLELIRLAREKSNAD